MDSVSTAGGASEHLAVASSDYRIQPMHCRRLDISLPTALRALADEEHLALIDSCGAGGSILTWGHAPQQIHDLSQLTDTIASITTVTTRGTATHSSSAAWPQAINGGALIQMDYEFPVGPWAAATKKTGTARIWQLDSWACWNQHGCELWGHDEQETATMAASLLSKNAPPTFSTPMPTSTQKPTLDIHSQWSEATYSQQIERIHQYINAGDVYQVNLTMPFHGDITWQQGHDVDLYLRLRDHSPAPYAALFRNSRSSFLSHSPERFLSVHNNQCSSHPIKGTCKRIAGRDQQQRSALRASEKDRAELAMIVDLVRNDIGRISIPGSVVVEDQGEDNIIDLPYVHHALAHIRSSLNPGITHRDLFAACFPPGSITGAPKIRAMEIIQELESQHRGAYCGCFGWLGVDNSCELAVAIRCMHIDGDQLRLDAGGGIVIDSTAASEWQELHDKASAMRTSLEHL